MGEAYLFPKQFRLLASDAADFSVAHVVLDHTDEDYEEQQAYPFRMDCGGLMARYLRLEIHKMGGGGAASYGFRSMLSEWFVFSGGVNVALGKELRSNIAETLGDFYRGRYLVDGRTPLGFPELKTDAVPKVGWHSRTLNKSNASASVDLQFAYSQLIDQVRLYPAQPRQFGQIQNYGFPENFELLGQRPDGTWTQLVNYLDRPYSLLGKNPAIFLFPAQKLNAVRLRASRLPRLHREYAMAFSEAELLYQGIPIPEVAAIRDSGLHNDRINWSRPALRDGYTSTGRLIGWHSWLNQLADRRELQAELDGLSARRVEVDADLRGQIAYFIVALLVSLPLLGGGFVAYVGFQRILRKRELARVRERIAGDLHDEVGSHLGGIQLHLDLLRNELPASQEIPVIQRLAAETMTAVRDIVWLLRPQRNERVLWVDHLRETSTILLHGYDWSFDVDEGSSSCPIPDALIHDFMLFFREALHNIRHAGASEVKVQVRTSEGALILSIEDDGVGIPEDVLSRPSTLRALKKRAEKMDAKLALQTEPGTGTVVALTLQLDS